MTMKRGIALLLVLALMLALPAAQAAPARTLGAMDLDAAQLQQLQPMLDGLAQAAWQQGVLSWQPGEAPPQKLQEGVLLAEARRTHPGENGVLLDQQQAHSLYGSFFALEGYQPLAQPGDARIQVTENGYQLTLDQGADAVGAYVYEVRRTLDDSLHLRADIYQMHDIQGSVEEAPEDSLTWLCGMDATLRQQEGQPDHWVATGLQLTPAYAAQNLRPYLGDGFALAVPDFFAEDSAAQPNGVRFVAQGVEATLTVERLTADVESEQALMQQLAQQNAAFAFSRQFDDLSGAILARAPGDLAFALLAGDDAWVLRLRFPEEREREYSLYFEFLCNSFLVDEVTVG